MEVKLKLTCLWIFSCFLICELCEFSRHTIVVVVFYLAEKGDSL